MREFEERRRIKKFLHSRYAILVLVVVCLLLGRAVWGIYVKYGKSAEIESRMRADLNSLEMRQMSLKSSIDALGTKEGREREIRDRFGVVKPGEVMVVVVEDGQKENDVTERKIGFWERFWGIFGL